jgi:hypothetical protein
MQRRIICNAWVPDPNALRNQIMAKKKSDSKRELVSTQKAKRYVRRDSAGRFNEVDDQRRSLSQDRRKAAKNRVKSGRGDRGDRRAAEND